jgi:hypothetical protein
VVEEVTIVLGYLLVWRKYLKKEVWIFYRFNWYTYYVFLTESESEALITQLGFSTFSKFLQPFLQYSKLSLSNLQYS